jgi:SnoaL-like protein
MTPIVGVTNIGHTNERGVMSTNDYAEVANLFSRLSHLLDDHRYEDIGDVYTKDAVVRSPRGELKGKAAITEYLHQSRVPSEQTQHTSAGLLITITGDEAQAAANQTVHYYREGEPPHQTSSLRVSYIAIRTPEGWRFREGNLKLAWTQKN